MSTFEVKEDNTKKVTITLNGNAGDISVGGNEHVGRVRVKNELDNEIILLGNPTQGKVGLGGAIHLKDDKGQETIRLSGATGDILAGGNGQDGKLILFDSQLTPHIHLDASTSSIILKVDNKAKIVLAGFTPGGEFGGDSAITVSNLLGYETIHLSGRQGSLTLRNIAGQNTIFLDGGKADLFLGGANQDGTVVIRNSAGKDTVTLGNGETGDLYLRNKNGDFTVALRAVESGFAGMWIGGHSQYGLVVLRNSAGKDTVTLGNGETGDLYLRNKNGDFTVALRAVQNDMAGMWIGGNGQDGHVIVRNAAGTDQIHLDGKAGDLVLANADCAEEFEIVEDVLPGTVMVIVDDGRLGPSAQPYDRRVAGIVSGAEGTRPGIVLGRIAGGPARSPIALAGRVACRVDARESPIDVGDLLTTSAEPGHAMRAADPQRAFGAVIGKALGPLRGGTGMIPVLVALQ